MHYHKRHRRGHAAVEFALIAPLVFTMVLAPMIGALGVFQYQQVGYLAQEAARWASVHGTRYAQASGKPAATATDVYQQVIAPRSTTLNLSNLTYSVTWNTSNSPSRMVIVNGQTQTIANTVTVTINYQWLPQFITSGGTFTSTSTATMSY
ncbi:MAG TPA: TadE/TadG family type IV pilus assembly protein [Pirellulales bacterium]|jgi:Flp pilus assembly protein TadG|nr:TadE/TadG family type IV pilus assembly protein [Pirellulales bacterium]